MSSKSQPNVVKNMFSCLWYKDDKVYTTLVLNKPDCTTQGTEVCKDQISPVNVLC